MAITEFKGDIKLPDSIRLHFGTGAGSGEVGDVTFSFDGTNLVITGPIVLSGAQNFDSTVDIDVALTAAGDALNTTLTINHATAAAQGIEVNATQLTTARSSGVVDGVLSATTSLVGDSGGVYNSYRANLTDGGGSATHNGIYFESGFDALLATADWLLKSPAANIVEMGSGDSLFAVGTASIGRKILTGDANVTIGFSSGGLVGGAGGGTAADTQLWRASANVWETGSGDSLFAVGTAGVGRLAATTDANPTAALNASGLVLGAGGATAPTWALAYVGPNDAAMAAGDSLLAQGTGKLAAKISTGDTHNVAELTQVGITLGVGGETAPGVQVLAGAGAPSGNIGGRLTTAAGVYYRTDADALGTVQYVTHNNGTNWGVAVFA